ncbi:phage tail length tape measure family protein [Sphingomonas sp. Leaf10]|uniref:phage tail length tape measure family protein n=1 Tax=Sphingomonas sp. Leaf10 TaxID=1735676 RepID=UPI000700DEF9|nr:phage tail length tape measure family protein [Sphingomonas sp. Leaf10]KQM37932.1 hypothetical protein ASE59_11570 [Sphingomonas sp. Leaf10]
MAESAGSVSVELIAKTEAFNSQIAGAATTTEQAMSRVIAATSRGEQQVVRSAGQMANGTRNLGRQFADVGASLSSGSSPFVVIAQQAPQVAEALTDMGGKAGQVAAYFTGPFGAAVLAAGSVLGVLAVEAFKAGESVDDLVEKLKANAEKARNSALAQDIFKLSLEGAAIASAKLSKELQEQNRTLREQAQATLAAAEGQRQLTIQKLKGAASTAAIAAAAAKDARTQVALGPGGNIAGAVEATAKREAAAKEALARANQAVANAENAVINARIPLLQQDAAAASDKNAAAVQRHERAVAKLALEYKLASGAASLLSGEAKKAAQATADRRYTQGVAQQNRTLDAEQQAIRDTNKKGPKGPSAATLARRAEAERVRQVRNDEAFNNELEQLNSQIASAKREQAVNAEELAAAEREQIASDLRRRLEGIDADESAKRYTAVEAERLRLLARQVAGMRNINVTTNLQEAQAREALAASGAAIRTESDMLRLQSQLVDTRAERRAIDLRLIDLAYQQERAELEAVATSQTASDAQRRIAEARLRQLQGLQAAENAGVERRYEGPVAQAKRQIDATGADLGTAFEDIGVDALRDLNDGLTDAIANGKSLGDVFKNVANSIISDLIRIAVQQTIIKPLLEALGGGLGGGGGFSIGSLFGRASGGYVAPGQTVRVNENRGGVELLRMGSQGGTVIPLGQAKASARPAQTVVHQHFSLDARGGLLLPDFVAGIREYVDGQAARAGATSYQSAIRDTPAAEARRGSLKA